MIPNCTITADDFFRGAHLENSARKAAFFKDRRLIFKAHFGLSFKADELQALLFKADLSHNRFIGNLDVQLVHLIGGIARLADEHGQAFRPNQVSFRRRDFLNRVQTPADFFGQCYTAGFIGGKRVERLLFRVVDGLRHGIAVRVLELERRARQRDNLAGFRIRFDEPQAVENRAVVERQDGRLNGIFLTGDFKEKRLLDFKPVFADRLLQHIHAIREQLGFGIPALVGDEVVALEFACVFIRTGFPKVDMELRAFFRGFGVLVVRFVVAQHLDDSLCAELDLVQLERVVDDDGFPGLCGGTGGIDQHMLAAGQITDRRRNLDDLIQPRPQLVGGRCCILAGGLDGVDDRRVPEPDHVSLTVKDIRARQHTERRAGQLAVAANGGCVGLRVFVFIAFFDADARHDGLIGCGQIGGFIRFHGSVQRDFLKDIARRFAMLADEIAPLAQRLGYGDAVFIGRHAADPCAAVGIVFVDVEGHARNGISVFAIRLGQAQPALCRLVHRCDFVGLAALKAVDFRSERRINIVRGHGGFLDAVSAIVEPAGFHSPLLVGGEQDGFANARAVGRRRRRQARDDELHACQRFMRQAVRLDDADFTLNHLVFGAQTGCFIRIHGCGQLDGIARKALRQLMFADVILVLAQRPGDCHAVFISGHCSCQTRAVFVVVVDVKLNPCKRNAASDCGFADADVAGIGFIRRGDFISFAVVRTVKLSREQLVGVMFRGLYF